MFLTCTLKSPHASSATVETEVFINESQRSADGKKTHWARVEWSTHRIALPAPETWTLDTVRATLMALRHFLPVHDLTDAHACIDLYGKRPVKSVVLSVRARGWEAEVYVPSLRRIGTYSERLRFSGQLDFSEPMIAALRTLRAESPIPLANIAPIDAAITTTPPPLCDDPDINAMLTCLPGDQQAAVLKIMKALLKGIVDYESGHDDAE